jgi:hypothetical protein
VIFGQKRFEIAGTKFNLQTVGLFNPWGALRSRLVHQRIGRYAKQIILFGGKDGGAHA